MSQGPVAKGEWLHQADGKNYLNLPLGNLGSHYHYDGVRTNTVWHKLRIVGKIARGDREIRVSTQDNRFANGLVLATGGGGGGGSRISAVSANATQTSSTNPRLLPIENAHVKYARRCYQTQVRHDHEPNALRRLSILLLGLSVGQP